VSELGASPTFAEAVGLSVSQDPANYRDAPTEGIRRVLEVVTGEKIPRGTVLNTDKIGNNQMSSRRNLRSECLSRIYSIVDHCSHQRSARA
jgi:hypothetical protein